MRTEPVATPVAGTTNPVYHLWYYRRMGLERDNSPAGALIRAARTRAGITQDQLADRLATSQSLIARWETGAVEPTFQTVVRAVRACGFDLAFSVVEYDHGHDRLISENLRVSPEQRLDRMVAGAKKVRELQRAMVGSGVGPAN